MIPVVRIGFQSAQYTVSENSTIATIIMILVSGGSLEREIIISISTYDSTATGTYFHQYYYFHRNDLCQLQLERTM